MKFNHQEKLLQNIQINHRPKGDDGSDDFIEGNYHIAQRLLLKIEEWEN